jgi:hypothetical protein
MNLILPSKLNRFNAVVAEQAAAVEIAAVMAEITEANLRKNVMEGGMSPLAEIKIAATKDKIIR